MSRNKAIAAVVAVAVLFAGWYFGSPRWTLYQMAQAAQDRDAEKLSRYIDYPALRESIKSQMRAAMTAQMMEQEQDGFGALGAMMGMAMVDPMIDGMVTPESMQVMFARADRVPAGKAPMGIKAEDASLRQDGLDQFRLVHNASDGGNLVFRRNGLSWKLSAIQMPDNLMSGDAAEGS